MLIIAAEKDGLLYHESVKEDVEVFISL